MMFVHVCDQKTKIFKNRHEKTEKNLTLINSCWSIRCISVRGNIKAMQKICDIFLTHFCDFWRFAGTRWSFCVSLIKQLSKLIYLWEEGVPVASTDFPLTCPCSGSKEYVLMGRQRCNVFLMRQNLDNLRLPSKSTAPGFGEHTSTHRLLGWLQAQQHS